MAYKWLSMFGEMIEQKGSIIFKGGTTRGRDQQVQSKMGNFISDQYFGGGIISGEIEFKSSVENAQAGFILYYDPQSKGFTTAGLSSSGALCSVLTWSGTQWTTHATAGDGSQLLPNRSYSVDVIVTGSRVSIRINGIDLLVTTLPYSLPRGQAGIWCVSANDIVFKNFEVIGEPAKVFVVMQFTPPYNELYSDVIVPVCEDLGLNTVRADETFGPGIIIADIGEQITESKIIIADITPKNPNIYYEVGYAHALNKPTIMIAEKPTELPFDISPYRVLFYENTIGGKDKVEKGLRKHLEAIQSEWLTG